MLFFLVNVRILTNFNWFQMRWHRCIVWFDYHSYISKVVNYGLRKIVRMATLERITEAFKEIGDESCEQLLRF